MVHYLLSLRVGTALAATTQRGTRLHSLPMPQDYVLSWRSQACSNLLLSNPMLNSAGLLMFSPLAGKMVPHALIVLSPLRIARMCSFMLRVNLAMLRRRMSNTSAPTLTPLRIASNRVSPFCHLLPKHPVDGALLRCTCSSLLPGLQPRNLATGMSPSYSIIGRSSASLFARQKRGPFADVSHLLCLCRSILAVRL